MFEPYHPRPIRFLGLMHLQAWRVKVYGIRYPEGLPDSELVSAARNVARARLTEDASQTAHYGVGFIGIHQGKTSNFVFVDWWADENELHHHVYVSPLESPEALVDITPNGPVACVWDLRLVGHERDAWVEHVLARGESPDFEAYLADTFNEDV